MQLSLFRLADPIKQFFSTLLVVTNIVGVLVGGFGASYKTLTAEQITKFLKVTLHVYSRK